MYKPPDEQAILFLLDLCKLVILQNVGRTLWMVEISMLPL